MFMNQQNIRGGKRQAQGRLLTSPLSDEGAPSRVLGICDE
jgi:hypothetical protein